uniref:Uncharacterized protein n=1 Tax=Pristionchus pacificus TaxID=54126 RepID=A0A2A6BVX4_PRIPA|eukprot:PDM70035.1 hypothetical protein PRIPAC_49247 [Pristionchus pacificus]
MRRVRGVRNSQGNTRVKLEKKSERRWAINAKFEAEIVEEKEELRDDFPGILQFLLSSSQTLGDGVAP